MLFSDGHKASWPTSKKNRHLLLAVAFSCRHVITSDQSSYFLVGHVEKSEAYLPTLLELTFNLEWFLAGSI